MNIILTSLLISLLAAACVWLAGRRDPGGQPWLTVLCLAVLLALPALSLLPKWHLELLGSTRGGGVVSATVPWWLALWAAGAALMLVRVFLSHRCLRKWVRDSRLPDDGPWQEVLRESAAVLGLRSLPGLRIKPGLSSPVVAGLRHPVILMPEHAAHWPGRTLRMALLHELGHLRRKDLWVRYAADTACALHWYNPLVWWMRSKLLSQCEYACDARVIATGVSAGDYVRALCDVVENAIRLPQVTSPGGVCAMAGHAPLRSRVVRLMHGSPPAKTWLPIAAAVLTTGTALGLSLVRPAVLDKSGDGSPSGYTQEEIDLRHSANPFPGN